MFSGSIIEKIGDRIAAKKSPKSSVTLNQSNTYIFPTAQGFGFLFLIIIQLVAAINYQNSLIYLCVFILGSVFFVSIWMSFLNVSNLQIFTIEPEGAFEGESTSYRIGLLREKRPVFGLQLGFSREDAEFISLRAGEMRHHELLSSDLKRGIHSIPRIRIESTYPFGFIRAWAWARLDAFAVVYPERVYYPESSLTDGEGSQVIDHRSNDEWDAFRLYIEGESFSRVNWKKFAALDELYVRDSQSFNSEPHHIDWNDYPESHPENRLKHMCFKVCDLTSSGTAYSMSLPGNNIELAGGMLQAKRCLEALARYRY